MLTKRIKILYGLFIVLFMGLLAKIAYIQFIQDKPFVESASRQAFSNNRVERLRGDILDRNGIPFTNREEKYTAFVMPAYLPKDPAEREELSLAIGIDLNLINSLSAKSSPFTVEINKESRDAIIAANLHCISVLHSLCRYDESTLARHVIGYLSGKDRIGQSGIEKAYEEYLRDNSVFEIGTFTDASGSPIKGLGYRIKNAGREEKLNVKLTLNYHIQKIVEEVMDKKNITGAVVVEDIITGDVLAMAGRPDFNQEAVAGYLKSTGNELMNKATAAYNLGSVFKIVDTAALFEYGDSFPDEPYNCTGWVNVNGLTFKCHSYYQGGHGELELEEAFAISCNSYFIELCQKIGYKNIINTAQRFGFGSVTGISDQGIYEAKGNLPSLNKYYSRADIANLSIGQGELLATPLQVVNMVAAIANGGIKNRVNIVEGIVDEQGEMVEKIRTDWGERIIAKSTADKLRKLMEAVTAYGTGTEAGLAYYGGAGGKTGSAETSLEGVIHAWFAGYFPIAEPRYAVVVFAENGRYGGQTAAPVFAEIARIMTDKGL